MPEEYNKILKYNHGEKSMKVPFIIYADLESLLEKMRTRHNNSGKSSRTKINKHIPSGYSLFTQCSFVVTKNKLDCYRGKDSMKNFSKDLKEYATKIINYEKKEMISWTHEENKSYKKQKVCYICKKRFCTDDENGITFNKKYHKVRDNCHYTGKYRKAAHNICNLRYKTPKEIPVVFRKGSTLDYHFIINELTEKFECLGENSEKYITFSVPINKELDNGKSSKYKIKFIDSFRFMSSKLSELVNDFSEVYSKGCRGCKSVCDFVGFKNNKLHHKCNICKKRCLTPLGKLITKYIQILQ